MLQRGRADEADPLGGMADRLASGGWADERIGLAVAAAWMDMADGTK
jgi:hypothetical protein